MAERLGRLTFRDGLKFNQLFRYITGDRSVENVTRIRRSVLLYIDNLDCVLWYHFIVHRLIGLAKSIAACAGGKEGVSNLLHETNLSDLTVELVRRLVLRLQGRSIHNEEANEGG